MRRSLIILIISLLFVIGNLSFCYATRPLYTEDCIMTPFGKEAIEIGGLLLSRRDNTGVEEIITSLKYGMSKELEFGIDLPYMSSTSTNGNYDGLADGSVKLKYGFYSDNVNAFCFQLGQAVDLTPNSSPSNPVTSANETTMMLINSGNICEMQYSLDFAYTFDNPANSTQQANDFIIYNASLTKELIPDLISVMGEMQYSRNTYTWDIVHEIAVGMNYEVNESVVLDTAIGCGLTEDSSSSNFVLGATILFN
jgi:hypothetical protein